MGSTDAGNTRSPFPGVSFTVHSTVKDSLLPVFEVSGMAASTNVIGSASATVGAVIVTSDDRIEARAGLLVAHAIVIVSVGAPEKHASIVLESITMLLL